MRFYEALPLLYNLSLGVITPSTNGQQKLQPLGVVEDGVAVAPDLEDYIDAVMNEWHVPGMAVAIIDRNQTWSKV